MKFFKLRQFKLTLMLCLFSSATMAQEWAFDVYLDKSKMGQHTFTLTEKDGTTTLTSRAKFNVKVLFVNAYSYDHLAIETWNKNCLSNIESKTTENKIHTTVNGKLDSGHFVVDVSGKPQQTLPECVSSFAYWNSKIVEQNTLLNPQNGEYLKTHFDNLGTENIMVKGKPTDTTHYRLLTAPGSKIKLNIELWYAGDKADNKQWVALKSITPEGYVINYKLI